MKQLWVLKKTDSMYGTQQGEWKLGTVIGFNTVEDKNYDYLRFQLEEPNLTTRYLVELEDGDVIEAWKWETYNPMKEPKLEDITLREVE